AARARAVNSHSRSWKPHGATKGEFVHSVQRRSAARSSFSRKGRRPAETTHVLATPGGRFASSKPAPSESHRVGRAKAPKSHELTSRPENPRWTAPTESSPMRSAPPTLVRRNETAGPHGAKQICRFSESSPTPSARGPEPPVR